MGRQPVASGIPRRRRKARSGPVQRWRDRVLRVWQAINAVPSWVLTLLLMVVLGAGLVVTNIIYQVVKKPTELLLPVSGLLVKTPAETWRSYGPLFRDYATATITAVLLAALAQIESAGNPAAHTYWRWNPDASDLLAFYRPASTSVGMYQMTNPAFADSQHFCIRDHVVVAGGGAGSCSYDGLISRVDPAHAVELTAIYLDRSVAAVLGVQRRRTATPQQKQDVATIIHLCGAGPAKRFVHQGYRLAPGETCGDHQPAAYLAQITALKQIFRRLGAGR